MSVNAHTPFHSDGPALPVMYTGRKLIFGAIAGRRNNKLSVPEDLAVVIAAVVAPHNVIVGYSVGLARADRISIPEPIKEIVCPNLCWIVPSIPVGKTDTLRETNGSVNSFLGGQYVRARSMPTPLECLDSRVFILTPCAPVSLRLLCSAREVSGGGTAPRASARFDAQKPG